MLNRAFVLLVAFFAALPVLADEDDWDNAAPAVASEPAPAVEGPVSEAPAADPVAAEPASAESASAPEVSAQPVEKKADPFAKLDSAKAPVDTTSKPAVGREVPVRYWVMGDSVEQEAIFVKIEKDTVYLKRPNAEEQKTLEKSETCSPIWLLSSKALISVRKKRRA